MTLLVRTESDPLALFDEVRETVHSIDPRVPPYAVITLEEQLARAVANERLTTTLLGGLAAFAVMLAGVGLFALLSYWTQLRRSEIGIRIALGARPGEVVRGVVSFTLALIGVGCLLGVALAATLARLLEAQLYGIRPTHPAVYAAGTVLLLAIGALAGALPTRQAAHVDPMKALRHE
jgi:ABC-type antimicrobial peptide transport system permease subunit